MGIEDQILMHNDPQRPAGTDGNGRLDAKLATHNEIAGACQAFLLDRPSARRGPLSSPPSVSSLPTLRSIERTIPLTSD